jgi:hypothetical protein
VFSVRSVPRLYNEEQLPLVASQSVRVENLEENRERLQTECQLRVRAGS